MTKTLKLFSLLALIFSMSLVLTGCNASSYAKKLEKEGYTVNITSDEDIKQVNGSAKAKFQIKWLLSATKANGLLDVDTVTVTCYESVKDAKAAFADLEERSALSEVIGLFAEIKGAVVFYGTKDAIEDAK